VAVDPQLLAERFHVALPEEVVPRFNVAPTDPVLAVTRRGEQRELLIARWGLVPHWATDAKGGARMINARAETLTERSAYRSLLAKGRCLILADGFYEWQAVPGQKTKQPFHIGVKGAPVFAFAGLWEYWEDPEGKPVESCTIITTDANSVMEKVHNRMPVILDPKNYDEWLDRDLQDPEPLQRMLQPYPPKKMQLVPVSTLVNSPRNDNPKCVAAVVT
jgi:putative SOS response-associated peptidase YedK